MKSWLVVFSLLVASPALAQQAGAPPPGTPGGSPPKIYVFNNLTPADVATIGKALVLLPYSEVATLLAKLQTQINEQDQPPKVPKPADPNAPADPHGRKGD